jgi:AraC family transcriptional regulator
MIHDILHCVQREGASFAAVPTDVESSWAGGSVHMRTMASDGYCQRRLVRNELAIGICFQSPGSAVQWRLEGKQVLDKIWTSTSGSCDMVVLPPGREFQGRCRGRGQGLWLFIDPLLISADSQVKSFAEKARVDCSWAKDRLAWTIATELRNECENGYPRGPMFLEAASTALVVQLAYVLDGVAPRFEPIRALSERKLRYVLDYMQCHLDHNMTLSELAKLVDLTPRYFCEVFKQAMGRPPHQFQIEQRVERAKSLLCRPEVSVTEVALMVGFSSQSHLNVYFRREAGVTPARYRAELRQNRPPSRGVRQLEIAEDLTDIYGG